MKIFLILLAIIVVFIALVIYSAACDLEEHLEN